MTIGERIRMLRERCGMTQAELGDKLGVSDKTISVWERDVHLPRMGPIEKLANIFNVSKSYIIGEEDDWPLGAIPIKRKPVPLLGGVAAGVPMYADQEYGVYVEADADVRCDFALRVDGDSMEPTIKYGDLVFVRAQPDVDDGEIGVVLLDDSATLKRVIHTAGGLKLLSDNSAKYRPINAVFGEFDTIRILGKAVAYKRNL